MHQSAFLRALAETEGNQVTLVVENRSECGRDRQGWQEPDFGKCEVIVSPSEKQLFSYLETKGAIHIFSGICSFPMVKKAFMQSCRMHDQRRMVFSEPWRDDGWRGKLRLFYYRWLAINYSHKVEAFLLTGKMGVNSYVKSGFPREKCHEWGYFTEMPNVTPIANLSQKHQVPRLIFIGTWDVRKNVLALIRALKKVSRPYECFLLGNGHLRPMIEEEVKGDSRFTLIGNVPNTQIGGWLSSCDVLVLPSLFDGWGAVVNEALMCGTRALVSNRCGASSLIVSPAQGAVFPLKEIGEALEMQIQQGMQAERDRLKVRQWANEHISGKAVAMRFLGICRTTK